MTIHDDLAEVLVTKEEISAKNKELGKILKEEYKDKNPLLVGVLKGALPFMGDLIQELDIYLEYDMMDVSSYGNQLSSSGEVRIDKDLKTSVEGRHLLFVEDIIDTGRTLKYLKELMHRRGAASVKIVTLLDKTDNREVDIEADWVGFTVPQKFVVGYGLDFKDCYRNLPYIGVLKEEFYAN